MSLVLCFVMLTVYVCYVCVVSSFVISLCISSVRYFFIVPVFSFVMYVFLYMFSLLFSMYFVVRAVLVSLVR